MTQAIRVGFVGAGFAARFHLRGLQRVYGVPVQMAGVTARSVASAEKFSQETGVPAFASFDDLCEAVDVIDLCCPPVTHEEFAVAALQRGRHVIVEKPFTGYFGDDTAEFRGNAFPKETMLQETVASCARMLQAAKASGRKLCYAENWIYAPAMQKEREIVAKSGAQILWMMGNQSHSGSHSPYYGIWRLSGGGSLVGKGCHPLSAALYLKRVEGEMRDGRPILPAPVNRGAARVWTRRFWCCLQLPLTFPLSGQAALHGVYSGVPQGQPATLSLSARMADDGSSTRKAMSGF